VRPFDQLEISRLLPQWPMGAGAALAGRRMRKILFRFGWLMLAIAGPAHAKTPMRPFTLTIRAEKQQVKAGDPVDIDVVMTNTSDHDVDCTTVSSNGLDRNYQYDVVDEGGQHVPEIEKKHHGGSSFWPCILEPGKTDTPSGGRISILYDLSRPGKYSIQRFIRKGSGIRIAVSPTMIQMTST
jgi:hypothetical protein